MPLEQFRHAPTDVDVYVTAFRYTEALVEHWKTHTNAAGRPTVSGFRGACWAPALFFDFDHEDDPALAIADAVRLITYFHEAYDAPLEAFTLTFSGSKGVHVGIPGTLFGGFEPCDTLPARFGVLAEYLVNKADATATADLSIYQHLRLFRVENTVHSKTGAYAIPLTADVLRTLDLNAIRDLARQPRTIERLPDDEWIARPELADLWHRSEAAAKAARTEVQREPGVKLRPGQRHRWLLSVAAGLVTRNTSEAGILATLRALNATETDDPKPDADLVALAHDVVTRYAAGETFRAMFEAAPTEDTGTAPPTQADRCQHCAETDERAQRWKERAEAAEAKTAVQGRVINDTFTLATSPKFGEEVRLLIALGIAHYRGDPDLEQIGPNRFRLTNGKAKRLCGKSNEKTAATYAVKLATNGMLPLEEDEHKPITEANGKKGVADVRTYRWPPPPPDGAAEIAEANKPTLLSHAVRVAARMERREKRGNVNNFKCPEHPNAPAVLRRHCSVCNRCLAPGTPQSLESKDKGSTLQTLAPAPYVRVGVSTRCDSCNKPAAWVNHSGYAYCNACLPAAAVLTLIDSGPYQPTQADFAAGASEYAAELAIADGDS